MKFTFRIKHGNRDMFNKIYIETISVRRSGYEYEIWRDTAAISLTK